MSNLVAWRAFILIFMMILSGCERNDSGNARSEKNILLSNYKPESVYKIPVTKVSRAKFPVIDMHSHSYPESSEEIDQWVKTMDKVGVEKTIILSYAIGAKFDSIYAEYARYPDRFEVWCGFDYSGYDQPGFGPDAVAELERCAKVGAKGVGELGDKGSGHIYGETAAYGLHLDDPRMDPLLKKSAELKLPVSVHVAEPIWMYEPMDSTNDGMMNAIDWRLDDKTDIIDHDGMIEILENAVRKHPETTFIAVHFANLSYDLTRLGELLDKYPNLWADISARYAETAPIPRFARKFYEKYRDRLLYGTDMGTDEEMYNVTFRILETEDEHFYETDQFGYHWYLNGFGLSDQTLKKLYKENAVKLRDQL